MAKHFGKCALCGKECELTFEHIPPRAAFNSSPARPVSGEQLIDDLKENGDHRMPWDTEGLKYQNQQQGMGRYSLCSTCNNNTGSWYAADYITFARTAHAAIQECAESELGGIGFKEVYPLRVIKQVLSMFCSINPPGMSLMEDIRQFVLDKQAVRLDKSKYKVCMYFTKSTMMRYAGMTVMMKLKDSTIESMAMSEITAYPFGFVLYFDPKDDWEYAGTDITMFADYDYDVKGTAEFPWKIEEVNGLFPEDYRTKDEIRECVEKNRKWKEEYGM